MTRGLGQFGFAIAAVVDIEGRGKIKSPCIFVVVGVHSPHKILCNLLER
jgi:hypothetical protein